MENKMIYKAISEVMADVGAVTKSKKTQQGDKYLYRGIDDVMNALNPAMSKHGIFIIPHVTEIRREERTTKNGGTLITSMLTIDFEFFAEDGSSVVATVMGEAFDSGDKSINKAMSIAFKYACFQVFCIPTEEMEDPDATVPDNVNPKQQQGNKSAQTEEKQQEHPQDAATEPEGIDFEKIKDQKINEIKINIIKGELERTGVTEAQILQRYKVECFEDITEEIFLKLVTAFKKTKDRG